MRRARWLLLLLAACDGGSSSTEAASAATATGATSAASAAGAASSGAKQGGADRQALDAEVHAKLPELRSECYEPYLRKGGKRLDKPLQLMLEIAADGSVRDAAAAGGAVDQRPLRGCIEDAARRWKLPAPSADTELAVSLPL